MHLINLKKLSNSIVSILWFKIFLVFFLFFSQLFLLKILVLAYEPTLKDKSFVDKINYVVHQDINKDKNPKKALVEWYYLFDIVHKYQKSWTRLDFIISSIKNILRNDIDSQKSKLLPLKQQNENSFWSNYFRSILTYEDDLPQRCFDYYDMIDDFAWAYNIPTSLVIATWKMETSCKFKPYNHWLFQIISKNYWTWTLTTKKFMQQLIDFFEFTLHKWNWYENANKKAGLKINLFYTWLSFTWIVRHWALYNWLSWYTVYWDIKPLNKWYVFWNFWEENKYKKDWLIVNILKVIKHNLTD